MGEKMRRRMDETRRDGDDEDVYRRSKGQWKAEHRGKFNWKEGRLLAATRVPGACRYLCRYLYSTVDGWMGRPVLYSR